MLNNIVNTLLKLFVIFDVRLCMSSNKGSILEQSVSPEHHLASDPLTTIRAHFVLIYSLHT